jgi:hypothetical protein
MKKKTTKIFLIALGIGLVAAALASLSTSSVPARADDDNEHGRQRELEPQVASDTVTLQTTSQLSAPCNIGPGGFTFDRSVVKSGVTVEPFTLPAGKVLVATSFDWSATGSPAVANQARTAWLFRAVAAGTNGPSAQSTATAGANGRAGGSETFPTGIVVNNPGEFCLRMDTPVPGEVLIGVLQGFLAPDK